MSEVAKKRPPRAVVLLGAQRFDTVLGAEVRGFKMDGPIATITAGWQERESEDDELRAHLAGETVNLRLHRRADEVFASDPEFAEAHRRRQEHLRHKQDFYRIRLEHALDANHVIHQRRAPAEMLAQEESASIESIRALDTYHLAQCAEIHAAFEQQVRLHERDSVMRHREELAGILRNCSAIAIAGGHVASLLNRLRLFAITDFVDDHVVFAWSAGAMAVSERIVLFHDNPPQGPGASEVLDYGLNLISDVVIFPQPETRLRLDDGERVSVLARRFAPASCLAFYGGSHVTWQNGQFERITAVQRLFDDGHCAPFAEYRP